MCGFAGFLDPTRGISDAVAESWVQGMVAAIRHRGPDDAGFWAEPGAALGHARLSIVDLSPAGHQPMRSSSGRYVIAFNGEVYNHLDLRKALEASGHAPIWRGHSDTETLLASIDAWGVEATLVRSVGMFAIALWDREERALILARDRMGEKPLYYGWQGQGDRRFFIFGSELKALRRHPSFGAEVDRGALALYMRHNYIPAPYSIYGGISKLEPGSWLRMSSGMQEPQVKKYWDTVAVARAGVMDPFQGSPIQAVDELECLAKQAIAQQMVADVPLGAFLSGGIDSSTVVALMQAQSERPVKTFTIGFNEKGFNEAVHARAVAAHLGTDHTELYVTAEEAMQVIPRLPALYDEPFSDSSQIPTYLVAALARQQVTVSLSGDGGDELFGGYTRYAVANGIWRKLSLLPMSMRRAASACLTSISPNAWDRLAGWIPMRGHERRLGDRLHKGAGVLGSSSVDALYHALVSHWDRPSDLVLGGAELPSVLTGLRPKLDGLTAIERMMALDSVSYLPDDILVKVDRAAMGVSLETRVPLIDHRIFEFAWRLPLAMKLRDGQSKWPLRQVLYRYLPKELIERPKMGFGVPIDSWLRGPLREWAEDLLDKARLQSEGFFNAELIHRKWSEHLTGQRNWQYHLWDVLMFQAWYRAVNDEREHV